MPTSHRWLLRSLILLTLTTAATTAAHATPRLRVYPRTSSIDFGTTAVASPVTRTVTLSNVGFSNMYVVRITAPSGFSVVNPPNPNTAIRPRRSVSVTLRLNATTAGTFSGPITYEINSPTVTTQNLTGVVGTDPPPIGPVILIQPNADAHIVQEDPDKNVGTQPILRIRHPNSGAGRYTFLRFNVPPIGGPIQSAVLRIRPQTQTITAASIYDVDMGWGERTITWNNWQDGGTTFTYLRETGTLAAEQWHEINVREAIPTGGGTVTLGITTNLTTSGFRFYSRESAYVPTLEITAQ